MTDESLGGKVRRNTRWQLLAYVISEGTRFLLVPVVISFVLLDGYSLVRIAYTFFGFFAVYSFGIHGAYINFVAECHQKREYARLNGLLSVGVMFCVVLGVITVSIVAWQREWIAHLLKPDAQQPEVIEFMIVYVAGLSAACVVFGVYRSILTGLQRMDALNVCVIVFNFVQVIAVIALLFAGYGVRMVIVVYGIALLGPLVLMMFVVWRIAPEIRIRPWAIRRDSWRPMLSLGGRMQALGVVALAAAIVDAMVLFRFRPEVFVGAYLVARQLSSRIQTIPMLGFGALVPAGADLRSRAAGDQTDAVYRTTQRITLVITAYLFIYLIACGDLVLVAYLGPGQYSDVAYWSLLLLCPAVLLHTLTGPGSALLRGASKPGLEIAYQTLTVVLFGILIGVALQLPSGAEVGELLTGDWLFLSAMPAALAVASAMFLLLANPRFHARRLFPIDAAWAPILAGVFVAASIRGLLELLPVVFHDSRWFALAAVGVSGALYTAAYFAVAWYGPGLTDGDKDQLTRLTPFGTQLRDRFLRTGESP